MLLAILIWSFVNYLNIQSGKLSFLVGISKENLGWWSNFFGNSCVIKNVVNLDNESTPGLRNYYVDGVTSKENKCYTDT